MKVVFQVMLLIAQQESAFSRFLYNVIGLKIHSSFYSLYKIEAYLTIF